MNSIDRQSVKVLRIKLQSLLDLSALGKELGLSILLGNACFTENQVTFKLNCSLLSKDGTPLDIEAENFKNLAVSYGLKPEDLGRSFYSQGRSYTIIGLKPRNHQYPILAERKGGKRFKFTAEVVKSKLPPPDPVSCAISFPYGSTKLQ